MNGRWLPASAGRSLPAALFRLKAEATWLAGVLFVVTLAFATPVAAQDTYLLVINGVEGDAEHGEQFHKWAAALIDAAKNKGGLPEANITYLSDKPERDAARIKGKSTGENVTSAFADLAMRARPSDEVFIVLFGHGSFDGQKAALQPAGTRPRTSPTIVKLLEKIRSARLVFVNTASSSGEFAKGLAGPGRTIVTATRTGGERNETRFPAVLRRGVHWRRRRRAIETAGSRCRKLSNTPARKSSRPSSARAIS